MTAAQVLASGLLNGSPGQGQPVPLVWPDTVCVSGVVEVCNGSAVSLAACDAAAPAPATTTVATTVVDPVIGLYEQRDTALATLNAAKAL